MATATPFSGPEQSALDEFRRIGDILAVPAVGKPLAAHRKWIVPCLDERAAADLPDAKEKIEQWRNEYTACWAGPVLFAPEAPASETGGEQGEAQAAKADKKQGRE